MTPLHTHTHSDTEEAGMLSCAAGAWRDLHRPRRGPSSRAGDIPPHMPGPQQHLAPCSDIRGVGLQLCSLSQWRSLVLTPPAIPTREFWGAGSSQAGSVAPSLQVLLGLGFRPIFSFLVALSPPHPLPPPGQVVEMPVVISWGMGMCRKYTF